MGVSDQLESKRKKEREREIKKTGKKSKRIGKPPPVIQEKRSQVKMILEVPQPPTPIRDGLESLTQTEELNNEENRERMFPPPPLPTDQEDDPFPINPLSNEKPGFQLFLRRMKKKDKEDLRNLMFSQPRVLGSSYLIQKFEEIHQLTFSSRVYKADPAKITRMCRPGLIQFVFLLGKISPGESFESRFVVGDSVPKDGKLCVLFFFYSPSALIGKKAEIHRLSLNFKKSDQDITIMKNYDESGYDAMTPLEHPFQAAVAFRRDPLVEYKDLLLQCEVRDKKFHQQNVENNMTGKKRKRDSNVVLPQKSKDEE